MRGMKRQCCVGWRSVGLELAWIAGREWPDLDQHASAMGCRRVLVSFEAACVGCRSPGARAPRHPPDAWPPDAWPADAWLLDAWVLVREPAMASLAAGNLQKRTRRAFMWEQPYLETCCRAALHRLFLCGGSGRPMALADDGCLQRLTGMCLAVTGDDGRCRITPAGTERHAREIAAPNGRGARGG